MTDKYRLKPTDVFATVLKGDVLINGTECKAGDYLVQTDDGHVSTLPKAEFERLYEKVNDTDRLTLSDLLLSPYDLWSPL